MIFPEKKQNEAKMAFLLDGYDEDDDIPTSDLNIVIGPTMRHLSIGSYVTSTPKKSFRTRKLTRAIMLFIQCLMVVGRYYAYDNPQALETAIKNELNIDDFSYNLLYSVYSIPNIIIPFIGGFVVDHYGVRTGIFLFTSVVTIGQGIIWLGGATSSYWLILIGRIIFGLTGECVEVAHQNIAVKWFRDSLGIAISLGVSFSRIGSASNSFLTPKFYEWSGNLACPFMVSFFICFLSFLFGLCVIWMDKKADEQEGILNKINETKKKRVLFEANHIKQFKKLFWLLVISCSLTYGTIMGFLNISNDYLVTRFNFTPSQAGDIITIYYIISMIFTPMAGRFTDVYGKRIYLLFIGGLILIGSMLAWLLVPNCQVCPTAAIIFLFMGLNISIYAAAFWPGVSLVVELDTIGTAYGFVYSLMNMCLIIIPIIIGNISDIWSVYAVPVFLVALSVLALLVAFLIKITDSKTGHQLERKPRMLLDI